MAQQAYQIGLDTYFQYTPPTTNTHWIEAGLAQIALFHGDNRRACDLAYQSWRGLDEGTTVGLGEPFRAYWGCYRVLRSCNMDSAETLLKTAVTRLHEQANRINDPAMRHTFLHAFPAHRGLIQAGSHLL